MKLKCTTECDLLMELKLKYDRIKLFKEILNDTFIIEAKAKQLHY